MIIIKVITRTTLINFTHTHHGQKVLESIDTIDWDRHLFLQFSVKPQVSLIANVLTYNQKNLNDLTPLKIVFCPISYKFKTGAKRYQPLRDFHISAFFVIWVPEKSDKLRPAIICKPLKSEEVKNNILASANNVLRQNNACIKLGTRFG